MTTVAPYRENRFQGFARRFSEADPISIVNVFVIFLIATVIWIVSTNTLQSMNHFLAASFIDTAYSTTSFIITLFAYGRYRGYCKELYEINLWSDVLIAEREAMNRASEHNEYSAPSGPVSRLVIQGEVVPPSTPPQ